MKKIFWIWIAVVAVISVPLGVCAAQAKVYHWRLQAFYPPPEEKYVISLAEFVKFVDKGTDGQIKITPYPGGALVPPPEIFKSEPASSGLVFSMRSG